MFKSVLQTFFGTTTSIDEARYVLFGAPLDCTASYRTGSRFAPNAIRQSSLYMESYSTRTGLDVQDISFSDVGDLTGLNSIESLDLIEDAVNRLVEENKISVMLGGEHTITLGALRAIRPDMIVCFDAHLDLRDELLGERISHGTFMRRSMEELEQNIIFMGVRAISQKELEFARKNSENINIINAQNVLKQGVEKISRNLKNALDESSTIYLSIDMDVVDPASAPAVGNPSPEGISVMELLDLVSCFTDDRVVGVDLTEVTPHYDSGLTSTQAAYILIESLYSIEHSSR